MITLFINLCIIFFRLLVISAIWSARIIVFLGDFIFKYVAPAVGYILGIALIIPVSIIVYFLAPFVNVFYYDREQIMKAKGFKGKVLEFWNSFVKGNGQIWEMFYNWLRENNTYRVMLKISCVVFFLCAWYWGACKYVPDDQITNFEPEYVARAHKQKEIYAKIDNVTHCATIYNWITAGVEICALHDAIAPNYRKKNFAAKKVLAWEVETERTNKKAESN